MCHAQISCEANGSPRRSATHHQAQVDVSHVFEVWGLSQVSVSELACFFNASLREFTIFILETSLNGDCDTQSVLLRLTPFSHFVSAGYRTESINPASLTNL
jgi:hypothetical protein